MPAQRLNLVSFPSTLHLSLSLFQVVSVWPLSQAWVQWLLLSKLLVSKWVS